jgi:hypothetical protein
MLQDALIGIPGVLQRVGQHREAVEGPVLVDGGGEPGDGASVPCEDGRGEGWAWVEEVAEKIAEEIGLPFGLGDAPSSRGCCLPRPPAEGVTHGALGRPAEVRGVPGVDPSCLKGDLPRVPAFIGSGQPLRKPLSDL